MFSYPNLVTILKHLFYFKFRSVTEAPGCFANLASSGSAFSRFCRTHSAAKYAASTAGTQNRTSDWSSKFTYSKFSETTLFVQWLTYPKFPTQQFKSLSI